MADTDGAGENPREPEGRGGERRARNDDARHDDARDDGARHDERAPRAAKRPAGRRPRPPEASPPRMNGRRAAREAALYLAEMTGKEFEGIVGIRRSGDDWSVEVEVLEMRRIPSTTDVLAVYEVTVDAEGELVGYERKARYVRGDAREERE